LDILDTSKYTLSCATKTLPISVKLLNEQQMMRKGKKTAENGQIFKPVFLQIKISELSGSCSEPFNCNFTIAEHQ